MLKSKKEEVFSVLLNTSLFRIIYVIDLFFGMIAFCEGISLVFRCITLAWGFFLMCHHIIHEKKFKQIVNYKILLLFLATTIVTTFLHTRNNFLPNLLAVYHAAVCFFLFYGMYATSNVYTIKKELIIIFKSIVYLTTLFSAMGLVIFFINIQIHIGNYWLGIFNHRLIGVYTNSNLLGLSCVIAIIGVHILLNKNMCSEKKHLNKIFYVLSVIINFLSLLLSDSNASFLFLIIYITVMLFYNVFATYKKISIDEVILKSLALLACCSILTLSSFGLRELCQSRIAMLVNENHKVEEIVQDNHPVPEVTQENYPASEVVVVGRSDYDVSSGRITLLKQAIRMYCKHPILGIGRGNVVDYGEKYLEEGLIFSDFHNGYVTILVSWGFVGFTIFMFFALRVAFPMCTIFFQPRLKHKNSIFANLFAMLLSYCIYSLFEKTLLSEITFMVIIFWLILGYAMTCYINYKNNKIYF